MTNSLQIKPEPSERDVLRQLAKRQSEIAALPIQADRIRMWKDFNSLKPHRPMVLAYAERGWCDLVPESELQCKNPLLREWEMNLRRTIYRHEKIQDDQPVSNFFNIAWIVNMSDYGIEKEVVRTEESGSYVWKAPVKDEKDFDKLHFRTIEIDRRETSRRFELANEILGDLLQVRHFGPLWWSCGLTERLIFLRGLEQSMMDMYDNPQLLHRLMTLLRDDTMNMLDFFEKEGVLSSNNDTDDLVGSAGVGLTHELPPADSPGPVRTRDMWVLGENQPFVGVGPEHFFEFALKYQIPVLNRFGLVCYGCCEAQDKNYDMLIKHLPKLRRVSVAPWADRKIAAEKLTNKYIYSWKPNPAMICTPTVDYEYMEKIVRETIDIAKGCCLELIMKDTHTFHGDRRRIEKWTEMAMRLAKENA